MTPLPQPLYNPHLRDPLGSADSKGLITLLESALTRPVPSNSFIIRTYKNRGGTPSQFRSASDPIRHRPFHPIEEKEPSEKDHNHSNGRNEQDEPRRLAPACDGPPETINHSRHRIQSIQPPPPLRNQRARIRHRRREHPELGGERNHVAHISIQRVQRGHPQADAKRRKQGEKQKNWKPESGKRREDAVSESKNGENDEADGKVHEAGKRRGNRKNEAWEINFGDQPLVVHHHIGGGLEGVGEISPRNERRKIENGIRKALRRQLGKAAEEKSENQHRKNGLENNPENANGCLLVADFHVAPHEKIKELAIGPHFVETKLEEAARRLDADGGASPGAERDRDIGLRDRSHAC